MASGPSTLNPVVIVGSGPGGSAAAAQLSDAGVPSLVIDCGEASQPLGATARIRGVTIAKRKLPLRSRDDLRALAPEGLIIFEELGLGGLSNHWACAVPRFAPEDFDDAARAGAAYTWPFGYAELEPWYRLVESALSIEGTAVSAPHLPAGVVRTAACLKAEWQALGLAAEAKQRSLTVMPYANGATSLITRSATAYNAYTHLIQPRIRAGKLASRFGLWAEGLEWSAGDGRVVAVVCRDKRSGQWIRQPCAGVVLAAGALRTPELLIKSRCSQFPGGIGNQHDLVGRYFNDHPIAKLEITLDQHVPFMPACYVTRPSLAATEPLYAAALMQWSGAPALARSLVRGRPGRSNRIGFSVFGTMVPTHEDRIHFELSAGDRPTVEHTSVLLRHPPAVHATLERARNDMLEIVQSGGWRPLGHTWNIETPGSSVHYAGSCRMHASDEFGVVDARGRVYGTPNVAIGDSSVFTTHPEKNPVLTSMALSARAADALARDLR